MAGLPQLFEEDIRQLDAVLREFLERTEATTAVLVDQGGFLITHQGDGRRFDLTTLGALASGAFMATQTLAQLLHEDTFESVYQAGQEHSLFITHVNEQCLLAVVFRAQVGVGVVKYFVGPARERIARQLELAHLRDPSVTLDLSVLNVADTSNVFKRRA
ncbi:MAG: roadblock/LC7 domain-containing protein [Verrucomicrobiae bacterium]|nr:roadblock/LC7 domain-containing protein [Verrucomicrobiae bacterium]MDW8310347.1 roadblock/LC7 domain-containing protein [Verrucomicrobiales bacterium]